MENDLLRYGEKIVGNMNFDLEQYTTLMVI